MIRLRCPDIDDEEILQLIKWELRPHSHFVVTQEQLIKKIPKRLQYGPTYVAVNNGNKTIGFIHVFVRENTLIIDMLAVNRTKQRKGIGGQLLQQAEQYGRLQGCTKSCIVVDYGNSRAERFYKRNGYHFTRFLPAIFCNEIEKKL